MKINEELSIKGMTINQIYSLYLSKRLIVNRNYQRKLCWTIEEKRNFIDTIINGYPVPLFLLAIDKCGNYEIIDGLQRLDAICTLIDQKYELLDGYFNLESMPDTIALLRNNTRTQKKPALSVEKCKDIANYPLPVSVFSSEDGNIEEVFKRINSTGKHLSLQELRQVGVNSDFANLVRVISTEIRGDASEDILFLNDMSNISLSNHRLPYSINISDTFWMVNQMFTANDLRMSRDEEVIASALIYIILGEIVTSGPVLNKYYGYSRNPLDTNIPFETSSIQQGIDRMGSDRVRKEFFLTMSCMKEVLAKSGETFRMLIGATKDISDISLQFLAVFIAMHRLLVKENKQEYYIERVVRALKENGRTLLDNNKSRMVNLKAKSEIVFGLIENAFYNNGKDDPAIDDWSMKCINIINRSRTEQVMYDFKIGLVELKKNKIDMQVIEKVVKTLTAINNVGPNRIGYIIIGIADSEKHAEAYAKEYNEKYFMENGFAVIGVEHDAKAVGMSLDRYTHSVKEHIKNGNWISEEYKQHILTNMETPLLYGHQLIIFKTEFNKPVSFKNEYYLREFTDVRKLSMEEMPILFENYYKNDRNGDKKYSG